MFSFDRQINRSTRLSGVIKIFHQASTIRSLFIDRVLLEIPVKKVKRNRGRREAVTSWVVGKRLIGQITLIKGNNVGRFHGRITMGLAGPFEYFPNAWPATALADMRALFRTHQCPVGRVPLVVCRPEG